MSLRDLVGHGCDQVPDEVACDPPGGFLVQLEEGELARAVEWTVELYRRGEGWATGTEGNLGENRNVTVEMTP